MTTQLNSTSLGCIFCLSEIPRTPLNKKRTFKCVELKGKFSENDIQQYYNTTTKYISKYNALIYSSICFFFKSYVYTTSLLFCCTLLYVLYEVIFGSKITPYYKNPEKRVLLYVLYYIQQCFLKI